jgi:hypothetical protein
MKKLIREIRFYITVELIFLAFRFCPKDKEAYKTILWFAQMPKDE